MKRIFVGLLILFGAFTAYADDALPTLDDIPSFLSESVKKDFSQKATELNSQRDTFLEAAKKFNDKTAEQQTDEEFNTITSLRSEYVKAVLAYNEQLAMATKDGKTEADEVMVPVSVFAMPGEVEFCNRQIEMLNGQMSFLTKERDRLKKKETGMRELVIENVTATRDLIQDMEAQSISVLSAMLSLAQVPAPIKDLVGVELGGAQLFLNDRAAFGTKDEKRSHEKMLDATADMKNLILTSPKMLPLEEAEATKSATDAVLKVFKIIVRHQTTDPKDIKLYNDLEDSVGASFDVIQAVNPTIGNALKATTGFPVMTTAAWALGNLENDRAEMERALHQNATALSYYDDRIAQVAHNISIYEDRLKRQPYKKAD